MARPPKVSQTTAVTNWEEELAADAKIAAAQEAHVGGGNFFSTRAGVLSVDKRSMPNNEIIVVIIDGVLENAWYEGDFDADNPAPPTCYAFGRDEPDLAPHQNVQAAALARSPICKGCEMNEYGSAKTGRGKACKNQRRLALIPAGDINPRTREFEPVRDPEHFLKTEMRYLKVPPTSIGAYAAYVKQLSGGVHRPPHAVFTRISLSPHATKQWEMRFEAVPASDKEIFPSEILGACMTRHKQEAEVIEFPYQPPSTEPKKAAPQTKGRKFTRG